MKIKSCPNCRALLGDKHAWGCRLAIKPDTEAEDRKRADEALKAEASEEHF